MSDEFDRNEENRDVDTGAAADESVSPKNEDDMTDGEQEVQRVYRVKEEYIGEQSDSQYRYKYQKPSDSGEEKPDPNIVFSNVKAEEARERREAFGRKVAGVALAVGVFAVISGGLALAAHYLSGGSESGGSSVASLTHESTAADETVTDDTADSTASTQETGSTASLTKETSQISTTSSVSASLLDVSDVVEEVMPSVVAVTNTTVYSVSSGLWSWYGSSSDSSQTASGAGSGVIIAENDEELLIVTNAHVVNPTDYSEYGYTVDTCEISVSFCNDVSVDAVVKGTDDDSDLAVIAVDLDDIDDDTRSAIKIATVGNSDELKAGNGVIAIGNALGFGQSVTVGYVSAVNREVTIDDVTRTLIQTDAAINPGNSGGGLFDTNGRLIGINCAKYASEDVEGIGYAIPITSAESIITELMNQETVVREKVTDESKQAWLGVATTSKYSSYYSGQGAFIYSVTEGGPADEAGIMAYDIITAVNDVSVTTWSELVSELEYYEGGETVTITYYTLKESGGRREYVETSTEVTLGFKTDMPESETESENAD